MQNSLYEKFSSTKSHVAKPNDRHAIINLTNVIYQTQIEFLGLEA